MIFENFCNPLNETNGPTTCSIACIDIDFESRRGTMYPDTVNLTDCHPYWADRRVKLKEVNYSYGGDSLMDLQILAVVFGMS